MRAAQGAEPGPGLAGALQQALDLLPYGVVACDDSGGLIFGNRIVRTMLGGLEVGVRADRWRDRYGLADRHGRGYQSVTDIPLVQALTRGEVRALEMTQRAGEGRVLLSAHARRVERGDGRVLGAVGVFFPLGPASPGRAVDEVPMSLDPVFSAAAVELATAATDGRRRGEPLTERVRSYASTRLNEELDLDTVARALGYSPAHLTTAVRLECGTPVITLIRGLRLEEGRRLLETTGLGVEVIARLVSPWDPAYFTRAFRRAFGASPSRWRALHRR